LYHFLLFFLIKLLNSYAVSVHANAIETNEGMDNFMNPFQLFTNQGHFSIIKRTTLAMVNKTGLRMILNEKKGNVFH